MQSLRKSLKLSQRLRQADPSVTRTRVLLWSDYMANTLWYTDRWYWETNRRNSIPKKIYDDYHKRSKTKPFDLDAALNRYSDNTAVGQNENESKEDGRTVVQNATNSDSDDTTIDQNENESKEDGRTVVQNAINSGSDNTTVGQDGNGSRQDGGLETQVAAPQEQERNLKIRQRRDAIKQKRAEWLRVGDADGGDAEADARLVEFSGPVNHNVYIDMYGMKHTEVFELIHTNDPDSISILNARVTHRAQRVKVGESVAPEIETAFRKYITVLRENWGDQPEKDGYASDLGKAYCEFWDAHDAHEEHKQ